MTRDDLIHTYAALYLVTPSGGGSPEMQHLLAFQQHHKLTPSEIEQAINSCPGLYRNVIEDAVNAEVLPESALENCV